MLLCLVNKETHDVATDNAREDKDDANQRDLCWCESVGIEKGRQDITQSDIRAPHYDEGTHVEDEVCVLEQSCYVLPDASLG